jgi:cytochrome c oxidase cbb3-type subunit 3
MCSRSSESRECAIAALLPPYRAGIASIVVVMLLLCACEREERQFSAQGGSSPSAASMAPASITLSDLQPGVSTPARRGERELEVNAFSISEGQRLYEWFNCNGCHANGGGAIGPALMDDVWIYGSAPANIYATIVQGRPNGMPSFRGRIPEQQVWQIVAYVRSLSGQARKDAMPSRTDSMQVKPRQVALPREEPKSSAPPSGNRP